MAQDRPGADGLSESRIGSVVSVMRGHYGYAIDREHVEFNPADALVMPCPDEPVRDGHRRDSLEVGVGQRSTLPRAASVTGVSTRCALSAPPSYGCVLNALWDIRRWTGATRGGSVAESHHRGRNWATIAAFTLIIAVNIGEGIDQGFDIWNWILIALGAVFIVQAAYRLRT